MKARLVLGAAVALLVASLLWVPAGPGDQSHWIAITLTAIGLVLAAALLRFDETATTREVALVAVLGAAAGAVRVPFAAIPSVQPTTFLVMASGYALGPLSGFLVGAFAAVSSNMVLGHGPWTPYQAVAWGMGGAAAWYVPRRWGVKGLAALGFIWGFVFGAMTNLVVWFTTQPVLTLRTYLAVAALSAAFDLAHAATTAGLFWFAGRPVLGILERGRARLTVRYGPGPSPQASRTDPASSDPGT